jgi:hypothetical protein
LDWASRGISRDALTVTLFLASFLLLAQAAAPPSPTTPVSQNASPGAPQNATPPKPVVEPSPDPASVHFLDNAGLLLVAIKPAAAADYEQVIRALQEAMAKQTDAIKVSAARGWRVFKATELDAKGNHLYIHLMLPTVTGFDYRPSLLLDELLEELAPALLSKYQEAFAMPPSKLNLTEFANMSVAPLPLPEIKKPGGLDR